MAVPPVATRETIDTLLAPLVRQHRLEAFCERHHISRMSLHRARRGLVKSTRGFAMQLSAALGVGLKRVLAALEASRAG